MKKSENINEIAKSLAAFQGQMKPAIKDSSNPFFKSRYSNLESVWDAIRDPLCKNEITAVQDVFNTENGVSISTTLIHSSGQWLEFGPLEIPIFKKDAHSIGSAISYGKRYALCAACGVVSSDEDDDGNKAQAKPQKEEKIITREQAEQLAKVLDECDPSYVEKVWSALKSLPKPITGYADMPVDKFVKFLDGAIKNRDAYQSEKMERAHA